MTPSRATPLRRKSRLQTKTRLKKTGTTKAKKVARQRAFYASAVWKRLRTAALERAGHRCEYRAWVDNAPRAFTGSPVVPPAPGNNLVFAVLGRCVETTALEVHHKTNARFGGQERPEDLQALCSYHHALTERQQFPHRQHGRSAA